jgi:glycosyltransferase involved in cell wall biosynthesis
MQNKKNRVFLLPCIQRGIIVSNRDLNSLIEKIAIKCNVVNLPAEIYELRDKLNALSPPVSLLIDAYKKGEKSLNNKWHDFENIDVSLILRAHNYEKINHNVGQNLGKPPTRLINAWSAGTIPIVDRTPSYTEIISNGKDGFIVDNIDDVVQVVTRLNAEIENLEAVRKAIRAKQQSLNQELIVNQWEELLLALSQKIDHFFENLKIYSFSRFELYLNFRSACGIGNHE